MHISSNRSPTSFALSSLAFGRDVTQHVSRDSVLLPPACCHSADILPVCWPSPTSWVCCYSMTLCCLELKEGCSRSKAGGEEQLNWLRAWNSWIMRKEQEFRAERPEEGPCGWGSKTARARTSAELLLTESHSTTTRDTWEKLADQFRMDKRKYCPHPAASFGNLLWWEHKEARYVGRVKQKIEIDIQMQ